MSVPKTEYSYQVEVTVTRIEDKAEVTEYNKVIEPARHVTRTVLNMRTQGETLSSLITRTVSAMEAI